MAKKIIYKDMSDKDLERAQREEEEKLHAFRFGSAGSKTRNVKAASLIRKAIARILTELSRRHTHA